ncbi:hypothetical protein D187_002185 [Cystobacter fuscus DSM 2262]|uniref:DUF4139 domain-containing protein n=1 Tax=Cystobacter fuscus (strain ATCC 25194 / DSM 2262 / NBRC 100088 / M29) TaxID=1242864 RepID=S9QFM4_CYSF2|nr:hypothetical protein [Cystobacter fuscus]EPX60099.1 hypothetical protein D187_002185 [Cystobacter fuscus DSM 2262]
MSPSLPIRRVVLYKHGVGYFERRGTVEGRETLHLDFKARDMNDVLKSMTVLDLSGGSVSSVSYDSTRPLEQRLQDITLRIPESGSLTALLGQVKGARVRARVGSEQLVEGVIVGLDSMPVAEGDTAVERPYLTLLVGAALRGFDLLEVAELTFLDDAVRADLEFYLATMLSSYKKDSKRVSVLTAGEGKRELFVSYVLEAPVWKTSYRMLLEEGKPPVLQGWAVVDNTGDEDWEQVELTLMAGLPVSFVHDLYNPRYLRRPVVEVRTEAAVAPVIPEEGFGAVREMAAETDAVVAPMAASAPASAPMMRAMSSGGMARREAQERSAAVQTVTKEVGELFEYRVQHPVTVRRNQSALVPILHRPFEGRRVLLYNRATREKNPLACLELRNTTGLTLEGGPVTVTEGDTYVGEAMLDTMKPEDRRLVPYAVELGFVVSVEDRSEEGPVRRAMVSHGVLTVEFVMMRRTHYHLRNKARRAQILFLEHPRTEGWRLDQVGAPDETTDHYWRFTRGLAAGGTETFTVTESSGRQRTYLLANTGLDEVSFFLSSGFIDERVARSLREIISLRERVARRSEEVRQRTEERSQLFKDQERIRANIESLKSGAPQRELVARFVTKLNEQEDRLEGIARELERLSQEQREAQEEVNRQIQRLAFSTEPVKP